jgi:integrase
MSIRKRCKEDGSFVWEFCITIQKHPRKQYRKSGFKTKTEAVKAEQIAIAKYIDGQNLHHERTTFEDLSEQFFKYCSNKSKSINRNYRNSYKNHLQYFYKFKLKDINSLLVENWVKDCNKTPNTIKECIKFCKAMFNYAIKHDIVNKNPFKRVETPNIERKERKRLTLDEAIYLLQKCKEIYPDFYPILATQIFTGVREGELLALKWSDLDTKKHKLKIRRQYTQGELKESLKTSSSYREIDVCPTLIGILNAHKKSQARISEFIFVNSKGNLHNPRNLIQRKFEPLLEIIYKDKKYMRFYDLRGTYVDILLSQGVPLKYIQTQVGHANFLTTMNAYSKLIKDVNEHAINVIEKSVSIL